MAIQEKLAKFGDGIITSLNNIGSAVYSTGDDIDAQVAEYLKTSSLTQIAVTTGGAIMPYILNSSYMTPYGTPVVKQFLNKWVGLDAIPGLSTVSSYVHEFLNYLMGVLAMSSIGGIPILTEKERTVRDSDVTEDPLIVQSADGSTSYVTDNTIPRPRRWTITGYIGSILTFDHGLIVKPSLLLQRAILDAMQVSRRPVWFKTWDGLFYRVLIKHLEMEQEAKVANGIKVNIELVEFIPYKVDTEMVSVTTMTENTNA